MVVAWSAAPLLTQMNFCLCIHCMVNGFDIARKASGQDDDDDDDDDADFGGVRFSEAIFQFTMLIVQQRS